MLAASTTGPHDVTKVCIIDKIRHGYERAGGEHAVDAALHGKHHAVIDDLRVSTHAQFTSVCL
jgi:hypothetical protein